MCGCNARSGMPASRPMSIRVTICGRGWTTIADNRTHLVFHPGGRAIVEQPPQTQTLTPLPLRVWYVIAGDPARRRYVLALDPGSPLPAVGDNVVDRLDALRPSYRVLQRTCEVSAHELDVTLTVRAPRTLRAWRLPPSWRGRRAGWAGMVHWLHRAGSRSAAWQNTTADAPTPLLDFRPRREA